MSEIKWIKINTNMFDDEKIKLIEQLPESDTVLVIWIKLLSQAGKTNASGYIYLNENIPYTDEMLSAIFNRPLSSVRMALNTFEQFGMIDIDDNHFISIENWEKHQNVDGMAKIKEDNRKRVAKHREKKKLELGNVTVIESNALEEELELELEEESNIDSAESKVFDYYISKNIIQHKNMTTSMKSKIKTALKNHGMDELKKIIDNYSTVLKGNQYFFNTEYTLEKLLRPKDLSQFGDEAKPLYNFLIDKSSQQVYQPQQPIVATSNPFGDMTAGE